MTPPTQQDKPIDLEALRLAADKADYIVLVSPDTILALLALIDVQQKKIAALEGVAGFAADLGVPNDGIGL